MTPTVNSGFAQATSPQASGAAEFYRRHTRADFLEVGYGSAPPRIEAALAEEVRFLRRTLRGTNQALEIGCGNGRLLEALRDCAQAWVGVDFLEVYLHQARARRGLSPRTGLAAGNAARLPFAEGSFELVLCGQSTFGLLGELKLPALHEAKRVARPGGRLVFVVYSTLSVVPRIEWYRELHRRGVMAPVDWSKSTAELLVSEDGHASECFERHRLEQLFRDAGLEPRTEPVGELYWAVQAEPV